MQRKKRSGFSLYSLLKNIVVLFVLIQFFPIVISSVQEVYQDVSQPKAQVGHIKITGEITDSRIVTKQIESFEKNDAIRSVLIELETPGGIPASSQIIFQELARLKKKKPVVALIENICASGGYYIACAADKIVASPVSLVGAIGVASRMPQIKGLCDDWKVGIEYVYSGKYKVTGAATRQLSEDERLYLQELADKTYKYFIADVARSRKLSVDTHKAWADGKLFTGEQAFDLKLVDKLGTFRDAVEIIKELATIKTDIKLVSLANKPMGWLSTLFGDINPNIDALSNVWQKATSAIVKGLSLQQKDSPILSC